MDEQIVCERCGDSFLTDDIITSSQGDTYCNDCYSERYISCHHCEDETFWSYVGADDNEYCEDCYNERFTECRDCGSTIYRDDVFYCERDDNVYCESCYPGEGSEYIREYHSFDKDLVFYPKPDSESLFLGVELETDKYNDIENCAELLHERSDDEELYHLESDSSLNSGMEIVSMPCTLDYHRDNFPWGRITKTVAEHGGRSHDTSTCGMHIHINRSFFGSRIDYHTLKLLYIFEKFWPEMVNFSRRSGDRWERYAARYYDDFAHVSDISEKIEETRDKGRYFAVNLSPCHTIELRLFRGTLNIDTIHASLEIVDFLARLVKDVTIQDLQRMTWKSLTDRIDDEKYPKLRYYLYTRELVNQPNIDEPTTIESGDYNNS